MCILCISVFYVFMCIIVVLAVLGLCLLKLKNGQVYFVCEMDRTSLRQMQLSGLSMLPSSAVVLLKGRAPYRNAGMYLTNNALQ